METKQTVQQVQPQTSTALAQVMTPGQLVAILVEKKEFDVEKLARLMELQKEHEAEEARKAYAQAMVMFRSKCPTIIRTGTANYGVGKATYTYAQLPQAMEQIQSLLEDCGLAATWTTPQQTEKWIQVTCTVRHVLGHGESTTLGGPPDMSGSKNPLQAVKSCWTYLRRITLFSLLGLVDKDEIDDDGQGGASKRSPKPKSADVTASDEEKKAKNAFREMCLAKTGQKGLPGTVLWDILAEVQTRTGLKTTAECTDWLKNCEIKWDGTKAEIVIPQDVSPTIQDAEWLDESTIPDPDPSLLDEAIKNKRAR